MGARFIVWTKGDVEYSELEAQLFHNGKMVASRKVNSGAANDERSSKFTVPFDMGSIYKRWDINFQNVHILNGNSNINGNGDEFFVDANPGEYVFKLLRKGAPFREFAVTVGADGRFVRPSYSDSFTYPDHGILIPAKVIGTTEKWNPNAWKTDMFYGNVLSGLTVR